VKRPANASAADVVSADISRRRPFFFSDARALDEQVLVDHTRTRSNDIGVAHTPAQPGGKIDPPAVAEACDRTTSPRIQSIESSCRRKQNPPVASVGPIDHTTIRVRLARATGERIEAPDLRATVSAQSNECERRRRGVHHSVDDDRGSLNLRRAVARVKRPRHAQLADVRPIDLIERGVSRITRIATRRAPVDVGNHRRDVHGRARDRERRQSDESPPAAVSVRIHQCSRVSSDHRRMQSQCVMRCAYTVELANTQLGTSRRHIV
jgi:hypothetical protein